MSSSSSLCTTIEQPYAAMSERAKEEREHYDNDKRVKEGSALLEHKGVEKTRARMTKRKGKQS